MELPSALPVDALRISESADRNQYITNAHSGFALKVMELRTLSQRLEPNAPYVRGIRAGPARTEPQDADFRHVLRRYDMALMRLSGFPYNTQRAFFHGDPLRTGQLYFRDKRNLGVSLLMTRPEDDRHSGGPVAESRLSQEESIRRDVERDKASRVARYEAFFTMFERRQAMTGNAGLAPYSLFIGDRTTPFDDRLGFFQRRAPLLPQHRYQRICALVWLQTLETHVVVVAERRVREGGDSFFDLHILSHQPLHRYNLDDLARDVSDYWSRYIVDSERSFPPVFSTPLPDVYQIIQNDTWPMILPFESDPEMLYRLGIMLETPVLSGIFTLWNRESLVQQHNDPSQLMVGSLFPPSSHNSVVDLLEAYPVPGGLYLSAPPSASAERVGSDGDRLRTDWMRTILMMRVYPYMLPLIDDLKQRLGSEHGVREQPQFTADERKRFRKLIVDTSSPTPVSGTHFSPPPEPAAPLRHPQASKPLSGVFIGAKKRRPKKIPPRDIVIRRVDTPQRGGTGVMSAPSAVDKFVTNPPYVLSWSDAEDARFIAVRRARELTQHQEPLLALKGWTPPSDGYAYSQKWRRKLLGSRKLLRTLSEESLQFLYGPGDVWGRIERVIKEKTENWGEREKNAIPRLAWEALLDEHVPKLGTPRYEELLKRQPEMRSPSSKEDRDRFLNLTVDDNVPSTSDPSGAKNKARWWLMAVAVGVSPPEAIQRQIELEFVMSAVLASLATDGLLLLFSAEPHGGVPDSPTAQGVLSRLRQLESLNLPGSAWMSAHPLLIRTLGSIALLAWEWGKSRGLHQYMLWLDRLWNERVVGGGSGGAGIITEGQGRETTLTDVLFQNFPLLRDLWNTSPIIAATTTTTTTSQGVSKSSTPTKKKEKEKREKKKKKKKMMMIQDLQNQLEQERQRTVALEARYSHNESLIHFVEEIYGYDEGEMERRFGKVAEGNLDASTLKNIARVQTELGGVGDHPGARQPTSVYMGWQREAVRMTNTNGISLRYHILPEEYERTTTTTPARITTSASRVPRPKRMVAQERSPVSLIRRKHGNPIKNNWSWNSSVQRYDDDDDHSAKQEYDTLFEQSPDYISQALGPMWSSFSNHGDVYVQAGRFFEA